MKLYFFSYKSDDVLWSFFDDWFSSGLYALPAQVICAHWLQLRLSVQHVWCCQAATGNCVASAEQGKNWATVARQLWLSQAHHLHLISSLDKIWFGLPGWPLDKIPPSKNHAFTLFKGWAFKSSVAVILNPGCSLLSRWQPWCFVEVQRKDYINVFNPTNYQCSAWSANKVLDIFSSK